MTSVQLPEEAIFLASLPTVPQDLRPKKLYVNYNVPKKTNTSLVNRGWVVVDTRLVADPGEALQGTLEGIRTGTIEVSPTLIKWLELEARVIGLIGNKERAQEEKLEKLPLEELLSGFSSQRSKNLNTRYGGEIKVEKRVGRAPGSTDAEPRDKTQYKRLRGAALSNKLKYLEKNGRHEEAAKLREENK